VVPWRPKARLLDPGIAAGNSHVDRFAGSKRTGGLLHQVSATTSRSGRPGLANTTATRLSLVWPSELPDGVVYRRTWKPSNSPRVHPGSSSLNCLIPSDSHSPVKQHNLLNINIIQQEVHSLPSNSMKHREHCEHQTHKEGHHILVAAGADVLEVAEVLKPTPQTETRLSVLVGRSLNSSIQPGHHLQMSTLATLATFTSRSGIIIYRESAVEVSEVTEVDIQATKCPPCPPCHLYLAV